MAKLRLKVGDLVQLEENHFGRVTLSDELDCRVVSLDRTRVVWRRGAHRKGLRRAIPSFVGPVVP